ncbi:MAG: sulfotransferase [Microthrixaceae bacterium]
MVNYLEARAIPLRSSKGGSVNVQGEPSLTSRAKRAVKVRLRGRVGTGGPPLPGTDDGLAVLESLASPVEDSPILIFSAGWRSGSTLLQRMVISSGSVLVWGEPYADSLPIQRMMDMLPPLDKRVFKEKWIIGQHRNEGPLVDRFIANLYPPKESLIEAQRAFIRALFAAPANDLGYEQWGIKEVRWGIDHARYMKALFPEARLIFLVRNPYDSYASYSGSEWTWNWPDDVVRTAGEFGTKWADLAGGFSDGAEGLGAVLVRYEDLTKDSGTVVRLQEFLGLEFDQRVLDDNLGLSTRSQLGATEIKELSRVISPVAEQFGYRP